MNPHASRKCAGRLLMAVAAISTLFLMAACSSNNGASPNSEGFSTSSLSGTYVFGFSGTDVSSGNSSFFVAVGMLTADGKGNFSSGTVDLNDPALAEAIGASTDVFPAESATGTYSVGPDGRGTGSLTVIIAGTSAKVPLGLDFVLTSTGTAGAPSPNGLITRFDGNGTGSGTINLQTTGLTQSSFQGSYAFGFSGADSAGNPFGTVGAFTLDGSGTITTGLQDYNDNGVSPGEPAGLALSGNVTVQSPVTTATLTTASGSFAFDVYPIDSTHLKFIESDTQATIAGDAFTQQTSIPSGVYAYTAEGFDSSGDPLAMGGFVSSDGSTGISTGLEDYNDFGTVASLTGFGGAFTPFVGGRTELSFTNFFNGNGTLTGTVTFAAYPSSGGIEFLEIDGGGVTGGIALPQAGTTSVATSVGYGLNLSAINFSGGFEEDDIAEFMVNGSNLYSGAEDTNDSGSVARNHTFDGTLTPDTNIAGHGSAASTSGEFSFNYYTAGSAVLILETDNNQLGVGSFILQNGTAVGPVAMRHMVAPAKSMGRPSGKRTIRK